MSQNLNSEYKLNLNYKTMKNPRIILLSLFVILVSMGKSQAQLSVYDANYTYTALDEDFSSSLDSTLWKANRFMRGELGLLIDSSATINVNVVNKKLELTMIDCPGCQVIKPDTTYTSEYAGGEIYTLKNFHYGIFECRAKFSELTGAWPAFWMIGGDGMPCLPGGYIDEIDIAEYFCRGSYNRMEHNVHHYYRTANCEKESHKVDHEYYDDFDLNNSYHIFKCIWTSEKIEYYIDEDLKHTVTNNNEISSESQEEWFPTFPKRIILSQQITPPNDDYSVVTSQTSYFDWVKVQQYFEPPVITLSSDVICTSGSAALDVGSEATNITWSLSPASLFSGPTSGTGTNASFSVSSSNGEGEITYSFKMGVDSFDIDKSFYVGNPDPGDIDFINIGPNYPGAMVLCDDMPNDGKASWGAAGSILEYSWSVYDDGGNYWQVNQHPMEPFPEIPMKDVQFSKPYGSVNGYVNVIVKARNTCPGWGDYSAPAMQFSTSSCGGMMLMMSPNPTSGETTVSIEPEISMETTLKSTSTENSFDETVEWVVEVYDNAQSLKLKKTKIKGINSTKINAQSWKEGVYTVRAKYKDQVLTSKLVVKK